MNWISKLEKKIGRFAIPNLMRYIIVLYTVGFLINMINPSFYYEYLSLNASEILRGQVWRLFTFLIQPPDGSVIFIVFVLYLYYMIGNTLEVTWGAFRFNLYFWSGVLFHVIAAIITYLIFGISLPLGTSYLNLSLFFAFAAVYPDIQFLLFFVIPVKVKYLAWVNAAYFGFTILQAFLPVYQIGMQGLVIKAQALAAAVSLLNFVLYYFSSRNMGTYSPKQKQRKKKFEQDMKQARVQYEARKNTHHQCTVCGKTELDDPRLEFRYCSKCNGNHEYCQDHLYTHTHIGQEGLQ